MEGNNNEPINGEGYNPITKAESFVERAETIAQSMDRADTSETVTVGDILRDQEARDRFDALDEETKQSYYYLADWVEAKTEERIREERAKERLKLLKSPDGVDSEDNKEKPPVRKIQVAWDAEQGLINAIRQIEKTREQAKKNGTSIHSKGMVKMRWNGETLVPVDENNEEIENKNVDGERGEHNKRES